MKIQKNKFYNEKQKQRQKMPKKYIKTLKAEADLGLLKHPRPVAYIGFIYFKTMQIRQLN